MRLRSGAERFTRLKRLISSGTLDAVVSGMSEMHEGERVGELPLDFTQFLSNRLGTETGHTLSMLGAFLLSFEPSGRPPGITSSRPPQHPASSTD